MMRVAPIWQPEVYVEPAEAPLAPEMAGGVKLHVTKSRPGWGTASRVQLVTELLTCSADTYARLLALN